MSSDKGYRTIEIQGREVCVDCMTHAGQSAEENYFDHLIEKLGREAAEARYVADRGAWSDADLAEIDHWALVLLDNAYDHGTICGLHADEEDAYREDAYRD